MRAAHADSGGVDELVLGVKVTEAQVVQVPKVRGRVGELVYLVVVLDHRVEDIRERVVGVRVRRVDAAVAFKVDRAWAQ